MRSARQEILSAAFVLAVPLAVFFIFPFEILTPRPRTPFRAAAPSVAFVTLTAEEESQALARAKSAWQNQTPAAHRMRSYLSLGDLPTMADDLHVRVPTVSQAFCAFPRVESPASPWRPSQAAPDPLIIPKTAEQTPQPAFSREELLKLN